MPFSISQFLEILRILGKYLKEYLEIQSRYTQRQMQSYAEQAQELGRLMTEAAQKAQRRT